MIMNDKKIVTEVTRIKELMMINEQLSSLIKKLFSDGAAVTNAIGVALMPSLRRNIDDIISVINAEGKYLPSVTATETIPEYMIRIASDSKVADDVIERVYKLFPDISASFDAFAKPKFANDLLTDQALLTDIAKTMNRTELNNYLRNVIRLTDDIQIGKILDEVGLLRAKLPITTIENVKVAGLKKWFIKPTTVQYTDVIQTVDDAVKKILGDSTYTTYFKGIDSAKPMQEYVDVLLNDIKLGVSNGTLKTEDQVVNYILTDVKSQYKEIQNLPTVKAWYDKMMPTMPKNKIVDGKVVRPSIGDWLKWNAKLGIPGGIFAIVEMLTTYDARMNKCTVEKAGSQEKYDTAIVADQILWSNECKTKYYKDLIYGTGLSLVGGPLFYIAAQLWDKFKNDHNISDNEPFKLNKNLLKDLSGSTPITANYTDDLASFKKWMDDQKPTIPNSSSATEQKPEDTGMKYKTYKGNGLTYKFCKGNFITSDSECK